MNPKIGDRVVLTKKYLVFQIGDRGIVARVGVNGVTVTMDPIPGRPKPPFYEIGPLTGDYVALESAGAGAAAEEPPEPMATKAAVREAVRLLEDTLAKVKSILGAP